MNRDAFVIMPFSPTASCPDWTEVYEHVFRRTLVDLGWTCERAAPETGSLIASIVDKLNTATVVLADVTDRNANVFYELGVRHSLSTRTIMVAQSSEHVPSDLKGYWHVVYGLTPGKVAKFREDLTRILARIEEAPERSDNPVADYLTLKNHSVIASENKRNIKRLNALITEMDGNIIEIESRTSTIALSSRPPQLNITGMNLLLDTYYIDLGTDTLRLAYEFRRRIGLLIQGFQDESLASEALGFARELVKRIIEARDDIQRGVFVEPTSPSFMQWLAAAPTGDVSCEVHLSPPRNSRIPFCPTCRSALQRAD